MKKIAISIVGLLLATSALAASARIGGFAALDLLTYQKKEDNTANYDTGIGVLDMKIYARHKKFSSKVKLDLDDKGIGYSDLNFVEEFTVSWKPNFDWLVTAGKGKVKFHRLHWGATENCFTDGGSILGTANQYRDLDNRPIFILRYGNYRKKFMNHFSIFANPSYPRTNSNNYTDKYAVNTKIDLTEERGFADKFEIFPTRSLSLSVSGLYYKHDQNPHPNYAFDAGGRYKKDSIEIWFEYIWGRNGTKAGHNKYAVFNSYENTFQLGAQYELNDLIDVMIDVEGVMARWVGYVDPKDSSSSKDLGKTQDNIKADFGVKFKVAKSTQITVGTLFEKKFYKSEGSSLSTDWAYQVSSGLSIWF